MCPQDQIEEMKACALGGGKKYRSATMEEPWEWKCKPRKPRKGFWCFFRGGGGKGKEGGESWPDLSICGPARPDLTHGSGPSLVGFGPPTLSNGMGVSSENQAQKKFGPVRARPNDLFDLF